MCLNGTCFEWMKSFLKHLNSGDGIKHWRTRKPSLVFQRSLRLLQSLLSWIYEGSLWRQRCTSRLLEFEENTKFMKMYPGFVMKKAFHCDLIQNFFFNTKLEYFLIQIPEDFRKWSNARRSVSPRISLYQNIPIFYWKIPNENTKLFAPQISF